MDFSIAKGVSEILVIISVCTLIFAYLQRRWKNREFFRLVSQVHGPPPQPIIGSAWKFISKPLDIINILSEMNAKYPSPFKFWMGQNLIYAIFNPDDLEVLMGHPDALNKDDLYNSAATPVVGKGLYTVKTPMWKKERKIAAGLFYQKNLDGLVENFATLTDLYTDKLFTKKTGKGVFDIYDDIEEIIIASITETIVGVNVNDDTINHIKWWLTRGVEIVYLRIYKIWYQCEWIFKMLPISTEMNKIITECQAFVTKVFRAKTSQTETSIDGDDGNNADFNGNNGKVRSFMDSLIRLREKDPTITEDQIRNEILTLSIGAHDTTTLTCNFLLMMLGMHQDVQEKVYQEIVDVLGFDRLPDATDVPKFTYLERVIKETLRLFPPGPILNRYAASNLTLRNCTIPKGASILIGLTHVHRNEKYWPQPLKFNPDRFLPENLKGRHPYSYIPFSAGPRKCIGVRFGMIGVKTIIAVIVRKYKIGTDFKSVEDVETEATLMLRSKHGYRVSLEAR